MVLLASKVGRENGNGSVSESGRPSPSNVGTSSSTTRPRSAEANVLTVTYWATLVAMALIIAFSVRSTGSPNALDSKNSRTFGTSAANCDGSFTSWAMRLA